MAPEQRAAKRSTTPVKAKVPRATKRQKAAAQSTPDAIDPVAEGPAGARHTAAAPAAASHDGTKAAQADATVDVDAAVAAAAVRAAAILPSIARLTAPAVKPAAQQLQEGAALFNGLTVSSADSKNQEQPVVKSDPFAPDAGPQPSSSSASQAPAGVTPAEKLKRFEMELLAFYGQIQLYATRRMPAHDLIRYLAVLLVSGKGGWT